MSKNKTRQLMDYRKVMALDEEFGDLAVCGYIRNFHRSADRLVGKCSVDGHRCKREMPQDTNNCPVYQKWLETRVYGGLQR